MIIRDEAKQVKDKIEQGTRDRWDTNQGRVDKARKNEAFILNDARPKYNAAAQWGKALTTKDFEAKLLRMNPNFRFVHYDHEDLAQVILAGRHDPSKPWHHKKLVYEMNDPVEGFVQIQICIYPTEMMPEFSIMQVAEKEVPNPEYISTGKPIGPDSPILKKFTEAHGVGLKGYRQVLTEIVYAGFKLGFPIITLPQIEKEFGPCSTAEWQQKILGGSHDGRPW
jgi:hypothetical protein